MSVSLLLAGSLVGCGGASAGGASSPTDGVTQRDTEIKHEDCAVTSASAEKIDVNGDGKADIMIVKSGGREACRAVDLNFDGKIDSWVYRDSSGQIRRREADYDRDGRIDEISVFQAGVLQEKHRATTLGGVLDTWHFYTSGKLARTERDSDGDSIVDQWWEYPTADKPECPRIHSDIDGDGRPDPGATVDVCKEPGSGYVPPDRDQAKQTGQTFQPTSGDDVPVELENKKAPEGATDTEKKEGEK